MLRNITQVYTWSKTKVTYTIICHLPVKLKKRYIENIILCVVKLLYGFAKTKNYQFAIYINYHNGNLDMKMLFYDTYLLHTKDRSGNFGMVGLQTKDVLMLEWRHYE